MACTDVAKVKAKATAINLIIIFLHVILRKGDFLEAIVNLPLSSRRFLVGRCVAKNFIDAEATG